MSKLSVLAISSSPRRQGNSETLLDYAIKGCEEANADVEKIILSDYRIKPCINCGRCKTTATCVLEDDYFSELHMKIVKADRLIFATPVFFGSMCAQLKTLIDRGELFWMNKYILKKSTPPLILKKGLVLACADIDDKKYVENIQEIFKLYFLCQDIESQGIIFQSHVAHKGEILKFPETLEKCRVAGQQLCN